MVQSVQTNLPIRPILIIVTTKNDQHPISPCKFDASIRREVMRTEKMIKPSKVIVKGRRWV